MRRFCIKKEIPCHQQGKQDGSEFPPSGVATVMSVVVKVELVGSGGSDSVTAK